MYFFKRPWTISPCNAYNVSNLLYHIVVYETSTSDKTMNRNLNIWVN